MLEINTPISALPKVGPKYKKLLEKLEVRTVGNLLYHFPFRYDDYTQIREVGEIQDGEVVTLEATLEKVDNIYTRNGKRLTKAEAADHTGKVEVVWFNQHYLKTVLKPGKIYYFSGKVASFNNKLSLISPEHEEKTENSLNTARLVPVYPETSGVSSKWLRGRINSALKSENDLEEFLPEGTLERNGLEKIGEAMQQIHFPDGETQKNIARHRFAFEELFLELLRVEGRRNQWEKEFKGIKFKLHKEKLEEFTEKLPFELTQDQKNAWKDILKNVQSDHPMNRLLEGDVGTGKTIVAVIAAYLAHLNGYETIYMAPTQLLAQQHYETFKALLPDLKIELKSQGRSQEKGKSEKTGAQKANIIVGTHALLFSKEKYEKLGLVIIDEQHRFGVKQRGKLIDLGASGEHPHVLTMTATPIPRTLALTIYGDLEISLLKEHPNKERKITTKVVPEKQRAAAYEWVRESGEQAFVVCPLIEESESIGLENVRAAEAEFKRLKDGVFKDVEIALLHGRMKPKEKVEILERFRAGKTKVLVSTPVIEVGIDIPEAAVIVIESGERYGLASLHQLRGRIGRGQKEGHCLIFMSNNSKTSYTRLKYLERVNSGFELAEIDMKTRGAGDMFGTMQHGFKNFKIADLSNVEMLDEVKKEAQLISLGIENYPLLEKKLKSQEEGLTEKLVADN
jgi:ATP-dependent DNA helicase RecG